MLTCAQRPSLPHTTQATTIAGGPTENVRLSGVVLVFRTVHPTYFLCLGTTSKRNNIPADVIDIPEPRSYGMGFDDGPNCSHNAFYEFLRENNQTATMFYIGSNVMDWPLQAQDAITDGHQISIHTWSHNYMTALTNEQAFAELYYTRKAIKLVTGVTPLSW
jgi:peptidoglycan/xylan/chitin deacetylase (PgdA/CDA1 family)